MKTRGVVLALLVLVFAFPALAQDANTITYNGFSLSVDSALAQHVNIVQISGAESVFPPLAPHTRFFLYDEFPPAPEGLFDRGAVVMVHPTARFVGNAGAEAALEQLKTLLDERPDLDIFMTVGEDMSGVTLPFLPAIAAGQVVRARAQYVETSQVRGISYVTAYRQDMGPFASGEFFYTFQGLSADGTYYISAVLNFDTSLFPAELEPFDPMTFNNVEYLNQSIARLNEAGAEVFTPSLSLLDDLVQTFVFE